MKQIPLNASTLGYEETQAVLDVLRSTRVTMGARCRQFEASFGERFGAEAVFVNSGSSANLLAFFALANHAVPHSRNKKRFVPGFEVIVPAVSWATTYWPIVQAGGVPVIVDSDPRSLQMKPSAAREALSAKTVAICPVHVLGNTVAMDEIIPFAEENDLWIIEDTCEALGARYQGKPVGTLGNMATFSFFFSHHITTIEGGMVLMRDPQLAELLRCMRAHGWTRDLKNRQEIEVQYPEIDSRFLFVNTGFNLRPTEINAALGLIQLQKLDAFNLRRNEIARGWTERFQPLIQSKIFSPMIPTPGAEVATFGYPVICREQKVRTTLKQQLEQRGIETRPIICGNIARQPAMAKISHRVSGDLKGADEIMDCGLLWGVHPLMSASEVDYVADTVLEISEGL